MNFWGVVVLIAGAIVIGLIADYLLEERFGYASAVTAIGAFIGGFVASEYLGRLSDWGTQWQGLRIFPALIGAVVVAVVLELIMLAVGKPTRTTGGYLHRSTPH